MSTLKIITRAPRCITHCPHTPCEYRVGTDTEWQGVHALGEHLLREHIKPIWTRDAYGPWPEKAS